jgi:regulation of enolase protein 1 (concanavalin A-like superfamily)
MADRSLEARKAFAEVPAAAARIKDEAVAAFLKSAAGRLAQAEPIAPADAKKLSATNHEAAGLLFYGLHNWRLGKHAEAVEMLRAFRSAKASANVPWLDELDPLATEFIERWTQFQIGVEKLKQAAGGAARVEAAAHLRQIDSELKTRAEEAIAPFSEEITRYLESLGKGLAHGFYRIYNKRDGTALDVEGYSLKSEGKVQGWARSDAANQQWELNKQDDGSHEIVAFHSGLALDLPFAKEENGVAVWQYGRNRSEAQRWYIEMQTDGWVKIRSKISQKILGLRAHSSGNGVEIVQDPDENRDDQLWKLEYIGSRLDQLAVSEIGSPNSKGQATREGDSYVLKNASLDIWNENDTCTYAFRFVPGNFDAVVRVVELSDSDNFAKAGLMARLSLSPAQQNVALLAMRDGKVVHQTRPEVSAKTIHEEAPNLPLPRWLKLSRRGGDFTTYHSADGRNWQQLHACTVPALANWACVGLAVTSHNPEREVTAKFDNFSVTPVN